MLLITSGVTVGRHRSGAPISSSVPPVYPMLAAGAKLIGPHDGLQVSGSSMENSLNGMSLFYLHDKMIKLIFLKIKNNKNKLLKY